MLLVWPLGDDGPPAARPLATSGLIVTCLVASLWLWSLPSTAVPAVLLQLGLVPAELLGHWRVPAGSAEPASRLAPLTSLFLHAGWLHLLANLAYLWLFGRGLETALGPWRLLALFLIAGLAGELAQSLAVANSHLPMIGASGGTAGLLGAYLLLFPRANILTLAVLWRRSAVIGIPALLVIGVWLALELASLHAPDQEAGGTAAIAHLAGFATGLVLIAIVRPNGMPLLQPARSRAFAITRRRDQVPQI